MIKPCATAVSFKTLIASLLLVAGLMAVTAFAGGHEQGDTDHHDEQHADDHGQDDSHDDDKHDDEASHVSELDNLRALHAWTNATRDRDAHIYVELENTGTQTITLTGAYAEIAQTAQLTGFRLVDGEPQYAPIEAMPLDPSSTLVLSPNGLSIQLEGLSKALKEGEHFDVHLDTNAGRLALHVEVESASARQHSHAGHAH
ncbi:copper chaperone PCu(A)C [Halomonas sp. TBZ9]|uniref:Copper chaperone PCu(A)C n=1 Tax=Vreelandella azerica TaxID=2732867 RepID=A0A7Y3X993_9GAMM|nr:copper chaperone PCu(A)C [Halomonas azerica]NOG31452.1 copper chaperone PCu(A)C [Halomonas azerica]